MSYVGSASRSEFDGYYLKAKEQLRQLATTTERWEKGFATDSKGADAILIAAQNAIADAHKACSSTSTDPLSLVGNTALNSRKCDQLTAEWTQLSRSLDIARRKYLKTQAASKESQKLFAAAR